MNERQVQVSRLLLGCTGVLLLVCTPGFLLQAAAQGCCWRPGSSRRCPRISARLLVYVWPYLPRYQLWLGFRPHYILDIQWLASFPLLQVCAYSQLQCWCLWTQLRPVALRILQVSSLGALNPFISVSSALQLICPHYRLH